VIKLGTNPIFLEHLPSNINGSPVSLLSSQSS